jgi:hypothetical protein
MDTHAVNGILRVNVVVYGMVLPKAEMDIFRVFAEKKDVIVRNFNVVMENANLPAMFVTATMIVVITVTSKIVIRISRFAISAGVAILIAMIGRKVSLWKTARAFAIMMRIAKELNTGPGVVCGVLNVEIRIRPHRLPIRGAPLSPRLFTKKISILIMWENIAQAVTLEAAIARFRLQKQHVQITTNVAVFMTEDVMLIDGI